jgi:hypothetical protein
MDGKVLSKMFTEELIKEIPVVLDNASDAQDEKDRTKPGYSSEETDAVKKTLESLGYM